MIPPDARTVLLLRRAVPVLTRHAEAILAQPEPDAQALRDLAALVTAVTLASTAAEPERPAAMLTTSQMATTLGITSKSLRRMLAQGRIAPAVQAGRFTRWRGDERPAGRAEGPRVVASQGPSRRRGGRG
jgi:hypothetical protein